MATQLKKASSALGATETDYTDLGDIVVPKGASRITGILAIAIIDEGTATEGAIGVAKIEFTGGGEYDGIPCATIMIIDVGHANFTPEFTPVNIPVPTNRAIACYIKMTLAQTGACSGILHLRFE